MKHYTILIIIILSIPTFGMDELPSMPRTDKGTDIVQLVTSFIKATELVQDHIQKEAYAFLVNFKRDKSLLVCKKFRDFTPEGDSIVFSINASELPLVRINNKKYLQTSCLAWGHVDAKRTFLQLKPEPLVLESPEPYELSFDGPNIHNTCIVKTEKKETDLLFTFSTPFENHAFEEFCTDEDVFSQITPIQPLLFDKPKTEITITAYALHAKSNRMVIDYMPKNKEKTKSTIVIINDIAISPKPNAIYQRETTNNNEVHAFKHLAFLTNSTLIGITHDHELYILAIKKKKLSLHKQKINIKIEDIAVDAHHPSNLIFTNTNKDIFYADLTNINPQDSCVHYKKIMRFPKHIKQIMYNNEHIGLLITDTTITEDSSVHSTDTEPYLSVAQLFKIPYKQGKT